MVTIVTISTDEFPGLFRILKRPGKTKYSTESISGIHGKGSPRFSA
jgi:hypothetical protein